MTGDLWPGRCDLCNSMLVIGEPMFVYFTPSTGTKADGEAGTAFWAEDPEWGACQDCKTGLDMLDEGRIDVGTWLAMAIDKSLSVQARQMVVVGMPADELREIQEGHVTRTLAGFIANRGPGCVTTLNEGVERDHPDR